MNRAHRCSECTWFFNNYLWNHVALLHYRAVTFSVLHLYYVQQQQAPVYPYAHPRTTMISYSYSSAYIKYLTQKYYVFLYPKCLRGPYGPNRVYIDLYLLFLYHLCNTWNAIIDWVLKCKFKTNSRIFQTQGIGKLGWLSDHTAI